MSHTATTDSSSSTAALLALACASQFLVAVDINIAFVVLPAIGDSLQLDTAALSWVISTYTIVLGGFLLLGGRVSDLFSRRRVFVAGIALFTLGSLACGLAGTGAVLIAARGLQGLGAALVSPAALAMILNFPEGPARNRAVAVWVTASSAGAAVGMVIGGVLSQLLGWEACFLVNVPVGIAIALAAWRIVDDGHADRDRGLDVPGAVLVTAGLLALVYGLVNVEHGMLALQTLAPIAAGLLLLAAFVCVEARAANPLVRLSIFRMRTLTTANVIYLVVVLGMFGPVLPLSLYLQETLGLGQAEAGLAFLPWSVALMAVAALTPRVVGRYGIKAPIVVGLAIGAVAQALLALVRVDGSAWVEVVPAMVLSAVGLGLAITPLGLTANASVPSGEVGLAAGLFNSAQEIGAALGVTVCVAVAGAVTAERLDGGAAADVATVDGYRVAFLVCGGLVALAAIAAAALLPRDDRTATRAERGLVH